MHSRTCRSAARQSWRQKKKKKFEQAKKKTSLRPEIKKKNNKGALKGQKKVLTAAIKIKSKRIRAVRKKNTKKKKKKISHRASGCQSKQSLWKEKNTLPSCHSRTIRCWFWALEKKTKKQAGSHDKIIKKLRHKYNSQLIRHLHFCF